MRIDDHCTYTQATHDTMEGLLESKAVELKEVESEIKPFAESFEEPVRRRKLLVRPKEAESTREETETTAEFCEEYSQNAAGSIVQIICVKLYTEVGMLKQHKAIVAFEIAAYAIYAYGDFVSV